MLTVSHLISCVGLFVALILPGFLLGKLRRVEKGALTTLGNLISDLAMPALVFVKLAPCELSAVEPLSLFLCFSLPVAVILAIYAISKLTFFSRAQGGEERCAVFCSTFSNCGFLGIPLAAALFPDKPEVTLYVSLANVVNSFFFLTLGTRLLSGKKAASPLRELAKVLIRPVTLAVILGVACSLLGLTQRAPSLISYFEFLSQLTTPLSMTVLGFELSQMSRSTFFSDKRIHTVALFKLFLSPLLALGILLVFRHLFALSPSYPLSCAMLIATGVSSAASVSAVARANGIHSPFAPSATLWNTLLCVLTLPLLWQVYDILLF